MSYKGRCMRAELKRCLRELLNESVTDIWKEASAWGKGHSTHFRLDSLCAEFTVSLAHVDDEDNAEYVTTIRLLPRVIKALWREIEDAQKILETNRRFWRVVHKLSK